MKKVFLTLALAAFAFAANAQFVVGGSLGFNHQGIKNTNDGKEYWTATPNKTTGFNINLKGGYQINEDLQAGLLIGFNSTKSVNEQDMGATGSVNNTTTIKSHDFRFGVYGRYTCLHFNKISLFAEGQLAIAMGGGKTEVEAANTPTVTTDAPKTFDLGLKIIPGISYNLTDNLTADLYLNFISLGFNMNKTTTKVAGATPGTEVDDVVTTTDFGFNATSSQNSITALWNNVSIGVTYRF